MMDGTTITGISSMATRRLLNELGVAFERTAGIGVAIESIGGVDAARRVRDGEAIDVVVLAANVMEQLETEGLLVPGSRTVVARSGIAVAVRTGTPLPDITSEEAVKQAVVGGGRICYSSGPSGNYLKRLFDTWGIAGQLAARTVEAKPGVPVGQLVASGEADLGFQQLSELLDVPGIAIAGQLPPAIQTLTSFTAAVGRAATHADDACAFIAYCASPDTAATKVGLGMEGA